MPPLQQMAFEVAESCYMDFDRTEVVKVEKTFACVVHRNGLPPLVAIAGRGKLVAMEVAAHIESRASELRTEAAMGVTA